MLMLTAFFENLLNLFLDTAVWLLFGLLLAAILKGWIPTALIKRWLSGRGIGPVIRAAIIGAPLPLCSCGVLPTAIGLRRSGASKPATVSFLVATPETGVGSFSVTYALLGPAMAILRPLSAIFSAVTSGIMVLLFDRESAHEGSDKKHSPAAQISSEKEQVVSRCCSSNKDEVSGSSCSSKTEPTATTTSACGSGQNTELKQPGILAGLQFAIVDILDDISKWLAAGLVLAAIIATLVEPESLSQWGSGLTGMLLMLVVGRAAVSLRSRLHSVGCRSSGGRNVTRRHPGVSAGWPCHQYCFSGNSQPRTGCPGGYYLPVRHQQLRRFIGTDNRCSADQPVTCRWHSNGLQRFSHIYRPEMVLCSAPLAAGGCTVAPAFLEKQYSSLRMSFFTRRSLNKLQQAVINADLMLLKKQFNKLDQTLLTGHLFTYHERTCNLDRKSVV